MNLLLLNLIILVYLLATLYLGYRGWKSTKDSEGYLVAGRKTHPYIMAMSYGATFISTSAIVGFGGTAGLFGMGLLWLTLLNIFVGIFLAFIVYGKRTRKIGHNLNAMTFPELLGKRFDSKFIQYFSGIVIFLGMPLYASVVLIGAARFMETTLAIDFDVALLIYSVIIAAYVIWGGLRGVMYTDAMQGTIMFVGMAFLLIMTYSNLGGITSAHQALTDMAQLVPAKLAAQGHTGWTSMPAFGSTWWWTLISTIVMGVGIGVLAMPQLVVRFMTVKSNRELNRGVLIGGIFILAMTGVAFVVGALSNVFFYQTQNNISINIAKGNADSIIPIYINSATPEWFVYLFMLTLLAAAMSTSSSQFHAQGSAIGRDIYETLTNKKGSGSILITRMGILIAIVIAVILGYLLPENIIARGTAIFFGLCAAAFLPMYTCALYWKRATRAGAIAGLVTGTFVTVFWYLFIHKAEAVPLGICKMLFGQDVLIATMPWPVMDPILVALPLSMLVTVAVSLMTTGPKDEHLKACFKGIR
ncbi:MAG: sodium:solute symporter family protein [Methanothrix sp.]|nr:sodium:solute symporter family protein [Methanothrix sp.]MDD1759938.1 sodium:solute symporter family protein [Methanothrix sp.]